MPPIVSILQILHISRLLQIAVVSLLQGELIRHGLDAFASKVVMDTVPYTSYITDVHNYNGINKALKSLVTTTCK